MLLRFTDGLKSLGILQKIREHPEAFRPLMCYSPTELTADAMDRLFNIRFSRTGSNQQTTENLVVPFWRDYLQDTEGK